MHCRLSPATSLRESTAHLVSALRGLVAWWVGGWVNAFVAAVKDAVMQPAGHVSGLKQCDGTDVIATLVIAHIPSRDGLLTSHAKCVFPNDDSSWHVCGLVLQHVVIMLARHMWRDVADDG